jgi:hypothetical protein
MYNGITDFKSGISYTHINCSNKKITDCENMLNKYSQNNIKLFKTENSLYKTIDCSTLNSSDECKTHINGILDEQREISKKENLINGIYKDKKSIDFTIYIKTINLSFGIATIMILSFFLYKQKQK